MSLDVLKAVETIEVLENFIELKRPPVDMRRDLDLAYRIDNQSVMIFSIRPYWMDKSKTMEEPIAKITWVHTQQIWKIFWMRSDGRWHGYEPLLHVDTIEEALQVIIDDKLGCFWG